METPILWNPPKLDEVVDNPLIVILSLFSKLWGLSEIKVYLSLFSPG